LLDKNIAVFGCKRWHPKETGATESKDKNIIEGEFIVKIKTSFSDNISDIGTVAYQLREDLLEMGYDCEDVNIKDLTPTVKPVADSLIEELISDFSHGLLIQKDPDVYKLAIESYKKALNDLKKKLQNNK